MAVAEAAASGRRPFSSTHDTPSAWLDRLLATASELPLTQGDEAVVSAICEALVSILPDCAAGVCLPRRDGEQLVLTRLPLGHIPRSAAVDPTRLFASYACERILDIAGLPGATLHLAGDDPALDDDHGPIAHLAWRATGVLGSAVASARAYATCDALRRELRAVEAHAIQADKLASFGQIAAGLVHELNNPLTSIAAYSDYLLKKAMARGESNTEDTERLRRIGASADRMLRFTRDLVSYARPSNDVAVLVPLHAVVEQALAFCEHVIIEAGAVVERGFGADVLTVRGMPEQIAQVFVNLLTNACHAVPKRGGRIQVSLSPTDHGRAACVIVEDNGHGIAPEHLSHVFAPFFTTKGKGRGTGLGLSIVKNIVENHGGTIRVESEAAWGTRFVIQLPLAVRA
jgi:signal transduction histidine kinase